MTAVANVEPRQCSHSLPRPIVLHRYASCQFLLQMIRDIELEPQISPEGVKGSDSHDACIRLSVSFMITEKVVAGVYLDTQKERRGGY